jgi:predicted anti-sigma-YlaC factor YlaD
MKCNEVQHIIETRGHEYANQDSNIRQHIQQCADCKMIFEIEFSLSVFTQERKNIQLPDDFTDRVMSKVEQSSNSKVKSWRLNFDYRVAAAISGLVFSIVMGIYAGRISANFYHSNQNQTINELTSSLNYGMESVSFEIFSEE